MLDSFELLSAMGGIREDFVLEAQDFLGYTSKEGHRRVKVWRVLLIAAIMTTLFTVTAYAAGWFGMAARSIEAEIPGTVPGPDAPVPTMEVYRWVSLNGYKDSPEYKANAEWVGFWYEYTETHVITNDNSWQAELDAETIDTCHFYGVYDLTMLQKLREIAERYGLILHTEQVSPNSLTDFYKSAGTGEFLPEGFGYGYIYEDGSFHLEADVYTGDAYVQDGDLFQPGYDVTILKNLSGAVLPAWHGIDEPEKYREWEYTNRYGDTVLMSYNAEKDDLRIFFDRDGVFIEVYGHSLEGSFRSDAEREGMADCIVFHELLKTEPDFSVVRHGPTVYAEPGDAMSLKQLLQTPEGQGFAEELRYLNGKNGKGDLNREQEYLGEIAEKHGLLPEESFVLVCPQLAMDAGWYAEFECVALEDYTGLIPQSLEPEAYPGHFDVMDNGVIQFHAGMTWQYIPKGSLGVWMEGMIDEPYADGWFYRTACGEVVYIAADLDDPTSIRATILYTGKDGWVIGQPYYYHSAYELESWADRVDFVVFS